GRGVTFGASPRPRCSKINFVSIAPCQPGQTRHVGGHTPPVRCAHRGTPLERGIARIGAWMGIGVLGRHF
ncbi:MAG: hypothetical protein JJU35_14305, partial [Balneolales bacterium]|nr:hypothetical protein [Balneolales bacterium]